MVQCFVKLAKSTPNMIGAMFRICFPVAEKPMIVKIPPIVGPFNSPPTPRITLTTPYRAPIDAAAVILSTLRGRFPIRDDAQMLIKSILKFMRNSMSA